MKRISRQTPKGHMMKQAAAAFFLAVLFLAAASASAAELKVNLKAGKQVYRVGEQIDLTAKGNKDYYLYLFSVDGNTGDGYLLLPDNSLTPKKYRAYKTYQVPGKSRELVADESGSEKIVLLASTRPIDLSAFKKDMNDFSDVSQSAVESSMKRLVVRDRNQNETCVQELDIYIR